MSQRQRIAVAGATGLLGSAVVQAILARSDLFELTIVTRNNSAYQTEPEVKRIVVEDYDDISVHQTLVDSLRGHDALVSTLNSAAAIQSEPKLVEAAIKAGVKHFMPSEYTLDVMHPAARELGVGNFLGARAAWAAKLAEIALSGQITYTTLVTGGFFDWGVKTGMLGFDVAHRTARLYDQGENKVTACTVKFVAEAVVAALQMPDEQKRNRRLEVAELEYTGQELLRVFERLTLEKWKVLEDISTASLKEKGKELLTGGSAREAYLHFAIALNFGGSGAATLTHGLRFGQEFGLQRRDIADIVRDVLRDLEHSP